MEEKKEKKPKESILDLLRKGSFESYLVIGIFLFMISSVVGMIINDIAYFDEDVLFWVSSTVFQGLLALLALYGAFAIFHIQSINSQISHKESLIEMVDYTTDVGRLRDEIKRLKEYKSSIKKYLFSPIGLISFTVYVAIVLMVLNNISFKIDFDTEGMIPSIVVFIIILTVWSVLTVYLNLKNLIFELEL